MEQLNQNHEQASFSIRQTRFRSYIEVDIEPHLGPSFQATVTDVSQHGMGLKTNAVLNAFDVITIIKSGYGRFRAEVRWVDGNKIGVLFSEPLGIEFLNLADG